MSRFENQVAIITGAAEGLGKGIASRLGSEGGVLALLDNNADLLAKTAHEFEQKGYRVYRYHVDVSNEAMVTSAIKAVEQETGTIDIMVHAAGIVGPTSTNIIDYAVS